MGIRVYVWVGVPCELVMGSRDKAILRLGRSLSGERKGETEREKEREVSSEIDEQSLSFSPFVRVCVSFRVDQGFEGFEVFEEEHVLG